MTEPSFEDRELKRSLSNLPVRVPPPKLQTQLRVIASREAARRRARASWSQWWATCRGDLRLWVNNLMRPLAIPTAGGFVSAVLLFGALAPSFDIRGASVSANDDVPTILYREPSVKAYLPLGFEDPDIVVELTIDDNGRMIDYSIEGSGVASPALKRRVENHLLFTHFTPATSFGQPMSGKVRLWFRCSSIDVKG
jgi:hypothetical protein